MESKVVIEGVHLTTLQFCLVSLKEGEPPYCEVPTAATGTGSLSSASEGAPLSPTLTYSIVGVVVVMLMMIFAVLVCIGTVSCYRRKKVRDRQLRLGKATKFYFTSPETSKNFPNLEMPTLVEILTYFYF